jgi:hypothetical protein
MAWFTGLVDGTELRSQQHVSGPDDVRLAGAKKEAPNDIAFSARQNLLRVIHG